jgi:hypothetical protein
MRIEDQVGQWHTDAKLGSRASFRTSTALEDVGEVLDLLPAAKAKGLEDTASGHVVQDVGVTWGFRNIFSRNFL